MATARGSGLSEAAAAAALRAVGLRVVARNVRTRYGEIDLLCRRARAWVAVEVKARHDHPAPERCARPEQLDRVKHVAIAEEE